MAELIHAVITHHSAAVYTSLKDTQSICACHGSAQCIKWGKNFHRCNRCKIVVCARCTHAHALYHLANVLRHDLDLATVINTRIASRKEEGNAAFLERTDIKVLLQQQKEIKEEQQEAKKQKKTKK